MKIHEYQAKDVLRKHDVKVPDGIIIFNADDALNAAQKIGGEVFVVKAQIHAGGRGKGGGVKVAKSPEEALEHARNIMGMNLVTHQTGPEGKIVKRVLIEKGVNIEKELYLGITIDRAMKCPVIMASMEGGVEIEKVAAENPDAIIKEWINPETGFMPFMGRRVAYNLGLNDKLAREFAGFVSKLFAAFEKNDCSLAEINPLVITKEGEVIALDAKMTFDDNAMFRHPDISKYRDLDEENPLEVEAGKFELNYIKLEGDVGCMVNGAGLAMATMDIIKLAGSSPANFLDVGGGANVETVSNAFRILTSDKDVKAVLVNIFGGIVRCDRVAGGIIEALDKIDVKVPIVIRLQGTNAKEALNMLEKADFDFKTAETMRDAADRVIEVLK